MTDYLTHSRLNHKFKNNFDLTNFAIKLAKTAILEEKPKQLGEILRDLEALPNVEEK